ncbi:APG9-domain-containing protein, partial [Meira miltonrushii]
MGSPRASTPSSSASRRRHERDRGLFSQIRRKIQKGADRIRAQDGVEDTANGSSGHPVRRLNAKDRALWKWGTLENMDEFLQEVYGYYVGKGLVCILLTKLLNLLTIAFVVGFSTFLVGCVDYSKIKHDGQLSDVVVHQCISRFSGLTVLAFALFVGLYAWQVVRFGLGISKLIAMRDFYTHLLNVPDADVQSISWHDVVSRIAHLRETHPTLSLSSSSNLRPDNSGKLDAHDVANRIMRQENYLVALFNKDVLDISIPIVGLQNRTPELTRTLEWNLTFCLLGFLFDHKGQVRKQFVTERHRKELIEGLKRRFIFMAIVNAVFAPFIVIYLLFYSFFRYFEEYHKNPSSLGARQYTQFARWKFREFNELPHIFRRRCHNSYPYAQRYIDQFPKERIAIIARFVSFVAGSFTAVLLLASVLDPDLFVHFDITHQRNVLFYIGVFTAILAVSRAMVPDEQQVFEPEVLLRAVIEYTHHLPEHWKGRFHSAEVHSEFGTMYRLKVSIFISELLSVIFTPFILWKSLPRSAPGIIDFFREFTVHVDGLGYVCSFAVFDFKLQGNAKSGKGTGKLPSHHDRLASNQMKMEQSLLGFRAANPNWHP